MAEMSFWAKLNEPMVAEPVDPWRLPLERLRGRVGDDGVERVATQAVFDALNIPQRNRGGRRLPTAGCPDP